MTEKNGAIDFHFSIAEMKEVVAGIAIGRPSVSINDVTDQVKQVADKEAHDLSQTELTIKRAPKQPVDDKVRFLGY